MVTRSDILKVNVKLVLNVEGNRVLQRGTIQVNRVEFKKDADHSVAIEMYKWKREIWRRHGCRNLFIESAIWNEENDITEKVRTITPLSLSRN